MKNKRNKTLLFLAITSLAAIGLFSVTAGGGSLEPASAPGPTMHTLEEIYNATSSLSLGSGQLTGPVAAAKDRLIAYVDVNSLEIQGESTDPSHTNWIEAMAVYYSAKHPSGATVSSVGGRTGARADFSELTIVKEVDNASPMLYLKCAQSKYVGDVVIEFTGGAAKTVYHKITLKDVIISSFAPVMSHRTAGEYIHLEEISFHYREIYWEYTPYDDSGPTGSTITTNWSLIEGRER